MKVVWILFAILSCSPFVWGNDCQSVMTDLKMPIQLRTHGKPRTARWAQVEKTMTELRIALQGHACQFTFGQVFSVAKEKKSYFPLISNVLRTVPAASLKGVEVYSQDGELLGHFENPVTFEKQGQYNYTHYYFQFRDSAGNFQSSGNRLLIDIGTGKPLFLVRWEEIRDRTAVSTR